MGKMVDLKDIKIGQVQEQSPLSLFGGGIFNSNELNLTALAKSNVNEEVNNVVTEKEERATIKSEDKKEEISKKNEVVEAEYQEECNYNIEKLEGLGLGSTTYLNKLTERIKERPAKISTGIKDLDYVTGGGWPCGISAVAASPNIGKTTILLQSAAAMAMQGVVVVYITYDMRELDLTAKVISHTSYKLFGENCFTIGELLNDNVLGDRSDKSKEVIEEVARTQKFLHIRDLIYDPEFEDLCKNNTELKDLNRIQQIFHVYSSIYKRVVFICDSLQQIAGFRHGSSGKESVDKQLQEFKGLSTYYEVPLILISTLNRSAYSKSVDIEITGLKESGNLEFDADTIIILQPRFIKEVDSKMTMDKFRGLDYRDITIKCIKSRDSGYREKTMTLFAPGCTFIECEETEDKPNGGENSKRKAEKKMPPNRNYS